MGSPDGRSSVKMAAFAGAIFGALVVLALTTGPAPMPWRLQLPNKLSSAYCSRLPVGERELCQQYVSSAGEDKGFAAVNWRRYGRTSYECVVEPQCLHADLFERGSPEVGSSCLPKLDGEVCGDDDDKQCRRGLCGGPEAAPPADSYHFLQTDRQQDAESETAAAAAAAAQQEQQQDTSSGQRKPVRGRVLAPETEPELYVKGWPTIKGAVWPGKTFGRVPETFVATSHEYTRIDDYGGPNVAAWCEIFKQLSTSPVIRVGGASQDLMQTVPTWDKYQALQNLQRCSNARFIFGLPLWQKNAVALSKQIMQDTQKALGGSIIGYELGNEPEFWLTGLGSFDKDGKWVKGFQAYAERFHQIALQLNPCGGKPLLSGPGWGNVNTQDPSWFAQMLEKGKGCYFWESNVHYYPYIDNSTVSNWQLLEQPLQDFGLAKFGAYQRIASSYNLPVRISETNSLYGGGRPGLSDTFAGTLWVADSLFAFSRAGARAFHLHWGIGGAPGKDAFSGTLGQPNTGVQTNFHFETGVPVAWPSVHAPWYAYLFFIIASAGDYNRNPDTTFVETNWEDQGGCQANIKLWGLKTDQGDTRVAVINKDGFKDCNAAVLIPDWACNGTATLIRMLPGPKGIDSKGGLSSIWGQTYENAAYSGKLQNDRYNSQVWPWRNSDGRSVYSFSLPKASGAVLICKPWWRKK